MERSLNAMMWRTNSTATADNGVSEERVQSGFGVAVGASGGFEHVDSYWDGADVG